MPQFNDFKIEHALVEMLRVRTDIKHLNDYLDYEHRPAALFFCISLPAMEKIYAATYKLSD